MVEIKGAVVELQRLVDRANEIGVWVQFDPLPIEGGRRVLLSVSFSHLESNSTKQHKD